MKKQKYIYWLKDVSLDNVDIVGGKTASLGEMFQKLTERGVRVPNGFGISAEAYWHYLDENNLRTEIEDLIKQLDKERENLSDIGKKIRQKILAAQMPENLHEKIAAAYQELGEQRSETDVAVRSSATAEDLPDASFAGQQETYLNVHGADALIETCKKCFASLFTDRAISYRAHKGFDHFKVALSICVQKMVRSDLASSGVMFSIDTETGFKNAVLINSSYGLGENVVQGSVNPDEVYVFKPTLEEGKRPILQKLVGSKEFKLVYAKGGSKMVKNVPVSEAERARFSISDDEILQLAKWACIIEDYYSKHYDQFTPMDIEWAKDGKTGELFIVQARPETVMSQRKSQELQTYKLKEKGKVIISGRSVGEKIASGKARVINDPHDLHLLKTDEILITDKTDPDWEPMMKKASGIVTNRGGRTCHAAIVSRELGLAAIIGTDHATDLIKDGQEVTISCAEGDRGFVYEGKLDFEVEQIDISEFKKPKTKIMMNVANPDEAFRLSQIPNDGVGLARLEFIINHYIKIHPLALIYPDKLDIDEKNKILELTKNYDSLPDFFVEKLAQGIAMIGAAFYPNDVIVRLSDFKTNEYANLIGGRPFEPHEENPMLGFRGASRYYNDRYREGFALECRALKKVRNDMGLTNVKVMVPFCRTVEEGRNVVNEMAKHELRQGDGGLEIYVMCEIPSNVILAEQFGEIFDGFSIGSNDLTQLILGVDRDSELIAELFDERNKAVKEMIAMAISRAHKKGRKIGICGQAPSDYPEFAQFLVKEGIDSISLNPDAVIKTSLDIAKIEGQ